MTKTEYAKIKQLFDVMITEKAITMSRLIEAEHEASLPVIIDILQESCKDFEKLLQEMVDHPKTSEEKERLLVTYAEDLPVKDSGRVFEAEEVSQEVQDVASEDKTEV